MQAVPALP